MAAAIQRRVYPAYGRELMRRRQAGEHPVGELLLLTLGFWPKVGDAPGDWTPGRALAIFDDQPLGRLELRMLAGLHVLIACDAKRFSRARELAQLVLPLRPAKGMVWVLDFETPRFFRCLLGVWEDFTELERAYWVPIANTVLDYALAELRRRRDERAA